MRPSTGWSSREPEVANSEEKLWQIARGFQASRILLTAAELGVFAALGDGSATSAEVARKIGADPRATDRLMNALVALELMTKKGGRFANSADACELLVPGKPDYIGGAIGHTLSLWRRWSTLTDAVKAGTSVIEREPGFVEPFIAAMHHHASRLAGAMVGHLDLADVRRALDVGGGSGAYSIAFCRANAELRAVVFDLPDVVPLTRSYVREAGMADRITTVAGDYNVDELGSGFQFVWLSQILHANSAAENAALIRKCRAALGPGGRIAIQEFIIDPDRTSPAGAALFSLNMLVGTRAGDTYTEAEITEWLSAAGFEHVRRVDPPESGTSLMLADA